MPVDRIDDQHMPIAAAAEVDVAGFAALDPVRLRNGLDRNRVERIADAGRMIDAVAFIGVLKVTALLATLASTTDVREAVASGRCLGDTFPPKSGCIRRDDPLLMNAIVNRPTRCPPAPARHRGSTSYRLERASGPGRGPPRELAAATTTLMAPAAASPATQPGTRIRRTSRGSAGMAITPWGQPPGQARKAKN